MSSMIRRINATNYKVTSQTSNQFYDVQRESPIKEGMKNMPIERWHNTLKQRTKVMRGMHNLNPAQNLADGFVLYYNFIRPHSSLKMTTAERADINLSLGECKWKDLIKKAKGGDSK